MGVYTAWFLTCNPDRLVDVAVLLRKLAFGLTLVSLGR